MTKQEIVTALTDSDFILDGRTDYARVSEFCKQELNVKLTNRATWAVIDELKKGGLAELDFD